MEAPIYHLHHVIKANEEKMDDFVGPLDLILHLLQKNKLEIKDISITLILEQYLDWMERRKTLDLEVASEFVTMASHLVYIKTKMLLAVHEEQPLSEMEELIATLEEHQRNEKIQAVRAVLPKLEERGRYGQNYLTRESGRLEQDGPRRYSHEPNDLSIAMASVLQQAEHKLPPKVEVFHGIVGREPYPVAEKAGQLLRRIVKVGRMTFHALFQGNRSRSEVVATFLAVLELCKLRKIHLDEENQVSYCELSEDVTEDFVWSAGT